MEEVTANGFLGFCEGPVGYDPPVLSRNNFIFTFEGVSGGGFALCGSSVKPGHPLARHLLHFLGGEAFVPIVASKQQHVLWLRRLCAHNIFLNLIVVVHSMIKRTSWSRKDNFFSILIEFLTSGNCSDNEKRLGSGRDCLGERSLRRFVGQILTASEKPHEGSAPLRDMIPDRSAQHWIAGLDRIKDRALRCRATNLEVHLTLDVGECSQMWREQ